MSKHKRATANDMSTIAEHAQDLLTVTADVAGDKVAEARKRLTEALEHGKEIYEDVRDEAVTRARAADKFIRANPYAALGLGVCAGVVIGFCLRGSGRD
jgi:ElaB/YqjD/DUF883 family membrane-anchored ribosome-binding protein